jgi:hypothetical protein
MVSRAVLPLLVSALVTGACGSTSDIQRPEVEGPPRFVAATAQRHADQFDGSELAIRPAGSEQEQAATAYLLGVLQRNGYITRLDPVPVRDLYRATNLIAQPPTGGEPDAVVVVPYDTPRSGGIDGSALGVFLELSRALSAADPDSRVHFVALGAEHAQIEGGSLGSRRLARFLLDQDQRPVVFQLVDVSRTGPFTQGQVSVAPDIFREAGFDRRIVSGGIDEVGTELFGLLSGSPR